MSALNRKRRHVRGMARVKRGIRSARKLRPFASHPRYVWTRRRSYPPRSSSPVAILRADAKRERRRAHRAYCTDRERWGEQSSTKNRRTIIVPPGVPEWRSLTYFVPWKLAR